jgi:hypothetical protein
VILDQAALSATTFIVLAAAARRLAPGDFALTSLLLALLSAITLGYRVVVLEPTLVPLAAEQAQRPNVVRATVIWASGMSVLGLGLLAIPVPAWIGLLLIGVGVTCALDAVRVEAFSHRNDVRVLAADALWPIVCLILILYVFADGSAELTLASYVTGAVAPLCVLLVSDRGPVFRKLGPGEWSTVWQPGRHLWREYLSTASAGQVVNWAAGGLLGFGPLAGVRGAMLLIGPLNIFYSGLNVLLLRQRRWQDSKLARSALVLQLGVAVAYFALAWVFLLLAPPDILGGSTEATHAMLPWFTACYLVAPVAASGLMALRFSRRFSEIANIRVWESLVNIVSFGALVAPIAATAIPVSQGLAYAYTATRTWRRQRRQD